MQLAGEMQSPRPPMNAGLRVTGRGGLRNFPDSSKLESCGLRREQPVRPRCLLSTGIHSSDL